MPLLMRTATVIHFLALTAKGIGVGMAFLLANIGILGSSKGTRRELE